LTKEIEMTLMLFSGAGGMMIHEKNLMEKISLHCPFKPSGAFPETSYLGYMYVNMDRPRNRREPLDLRLFNF
jgi:hypothetical protein